MPTGYTAKLMEHGQTFPEFVMQCARAFGACVEMRDEPMDAPIPERFEPSDYSARRLAEAETELARLKAMTHDESLAFGEAGKSKSLAGFEKCLATEIEQNKRLEEMEARVNAWTPPSADYVELKTFMLQQIGTSKHRTEYLQNAMALEREKSGMEFYIAAVQAAKHEIEFASKHHEEEVARAHDRTEWVRQLRESIQ